MKIWITADTHFLHANILKYSPDTRPFATSEEMTTALIEDWNSKVATTDTVYHLGDFAFTNVETATAIANKLNGKKFLIQGNHDAKLIKHEAFNRKFEAVYNYYEIKHNKANIIMCHYPILRWNRMHYGSCHFYGHVHGKPTGLEKYRACDVGIDAQKEIKLLDDVLDLVMSRPINDS
jgi:calcineurin-like phosphoesterase family protein